MAYGQLFTYRDDRQDSTSDNLLWVQSAMWDLRTLHGGRSDVWKNGRDLDEGYAYVSRILKTVSGTPILVETKS